MTTAVAATTTKLIKFWVLCQHKQNPNLLMDFDKLSPIKISNHLPLIKRLNSGGRGGVAQRLCSCFTRSGPWFDSCCSQFFLANGRLIIIMIMIHLRRNYSMQDSKFKFLDPSISNSRAITEIYLRTRDVAIVSLSVGTASINGISPWVSGCFNEAVSNVNTPLDGCNYPGRKMFHFVQTKLFLNNQRTLQANIRDQ